MITISKKLQYSIITSLGDESSSSLPDHFDSNPNKNYLSTIQISRTKIEDIIYSLNTSKAIGPDLVNPRVLKEVYKISYYNFVLFRAPDWLIVVT
jgi:hypothetical protein